MKRILILVMLFGNLFQTINSTLCRVMLEDSILPYTDKSIPFISEVFSLDNLILEQIDDDNVQVGGYLEVIKSMDRSLPLVVNIRTQTFEKATWNEAPLRMTIPSMCHEFINPQRPWYNISKLWTLDVCPGKIGDKWKIETHLINIIKDVPPTMPIVPWRAYMISTQGLPGFDKFKFGYGLQFEFIPI